MKPSTEKALLRALRAVSRAPRVRKRTLAPFTLGLAVVIGHALLTRLVPALWAELLPGGLRALPWLPRPAVVVWRLAVACPPHPLGAVVAGLAIALGGSIACRSIPRLRWPLRLLAMLAVAADAAILYVAVATTYKAALSRVGPLLMVFPELDTP